MRFIYKMYINLKKDYYLFRASECLAAAGEHLETDEFNVWMEQYNKYMDKAIDSIERV